MVKFAYQLEAQLIPEWKDEFFNYRLLKKIVKRIKLSRPKSPSSQAPSAGLSLLDPIRSLAAGFSSSAAFRNHGDTSIQGDEENLYETELVQSREVEEDKENLYEIGRVQSREDEETEFFEKVVEELNKVNNFYMMKEVEFRERGEILKKQLQILLDLKQILNHHRHRCINRGSTQASTGESVVDTDTPSSEGSSMADEMITSLERNGVSFVGSTRSKAKKGGRLKAATMRIDIPATTATQTISAITSKIWEDLVTTRRDEVGGDYISGKKIQYAERMIRGAFVEFYRGLGLLNTYSSLNMEAFRKIVKKYDKVTNYQPSGSYLKVESLHFVSTDKVDRLADEMESIFTEHFANNDREKAMMILRPQQPKDSEMITFFQGLFTGIALCRVYAIWALLSNILSSTTEAGSLETVDPIYSMFALLSLHVFLYGCNLFMWRSTKINHNYIFEFSPKTALKHRDAFLICTSFITMVIGAMVIHLLLRSAGISPHHVDAIPGFLVVLFTGLLLCPCNVFYCSTRYSFLRVIRNIVLSPLYKVLMVDFFMADQLTSQIPLLRHMEFTACYFTAIGFKTHPYETCTKSQQYKFLAYVISFMPYYCRTMQCMRRYIEEGYDIDHLANAGKYISAILAAAARWKYVVEPTPAWLTLVIISSALATCYQLYWDYVKDWGLLNLSSKNTWLRDELILKNKTIYYASMALNIVLRLAWIETVMHVNLGRVEHRLIDFFLASLEIIRRGHWNFYRLENEHLKNVGKSRAVKTMPLPFREMESHGQETIVDECT